jgi:hypothetical protein
VLLSAVKNLEVNDSSSLLLPDHSAAVYRPIENIDFLSKRNGRRPGVMAVFAVKCLVNDVQETKNLHQSRCHEFPRKLRVIHANRIALQAANFAVQYVVPGIRLRQKLPRSLAVIVIHIYFLGRQRLGQEEKPLQSGFIIDKGGDTGSFERIPDDLGFFRLVKRRNYGLSGFHRNVRYTRLAATPQTCALIFSNKTC